MISNQRQEWEASHGQERYVTYLGGVFQGTAKPKGNSELELPGAVGGEVKVGDTGVEKTMKNTKRGRATGVSANGDDSTLFRQGDC